ncbi:hypothetical protein ACEQPO_06260 [Bacillus sp. SL00103]
MVHLSQKKWQDHDKRIKTGYVSLLKTKDLHGYILDETPITFEVIIPIQQNQSSFHKKNPYENKCIRSDEKEGKMVKASRCSL